MIKNTLINQISKIKFVQKIFKGKATILMLHRISPLNHQKIPANENMKVSPEFLEDFIIKAKSQGYRFISVDSMYEGLMNNTLEEKSLIVTIDDGYKDNLEFGYPIFKKHQIPFCIYVCTSFPENTHNMWWFALEDYLLKNNRVNLLGEFLNISSKESKQEAFLKFREIIIANSNNYEDATGIMNQLGIFYDPRDYDRLALKYEEIRTLLKDELVTIGNHTHTHPIFSNLAQEEIIADIKKANSAFKTHLNHTPKHFAYPFGSRIEVKKEHFELLKILGFKTAVTTRNGHIYPQHKNFMTCLPRVFVTENFELQSTFRLRKKIIITD
ncbi:polysaccharide deacetylase family protein [Helicobacter cappadocius]|uniref:Polysaccharide deacetylase family protein n=1 Tax=Helicobacter cappadocius TaxID=3063998 RepID=A0AA90PK93_9HELI|nr:MULTISPECIES: polysaccharide deacetylase family protein [unclassified Helicobacter]MDO7253875.1 polysaccharide deacetylase family protein [Helicobacter sp. faydin-H75]MDP2539807.1 polysaccharide deacetylase family protein [Helicobacter sp. faydin-H76]